MGDGGRAQARLVGKNAPGHALAHGHHDAVAGGAAPHRPQAERPGQDVGKGPGHLVDAQNDQSQTRQNVKGRHKGDQVGGDLSDALDAPQHHHRHHGGQHQTHRQTHGGRTLGPGEAHHRTGDLAALGDVADAEAGQHPQNGKQHRQPFPVFAQTVFNVVHGAAVVHPVFVLVAEPDGQSDLGVFGAHAQKSGYPHPEHRPRAADEDGAGDAGDVAGAHGAGQRGAHRLEGRQILPVVRPRRPEQSSHRVAQDIPEPAHLDAPGAHRQPGAGAHQKQQHHRPPGKIVQHPVDRLDALQQFFHSFFLPLTLSPLFSSACEFHDTTFFVLVTNTNVLLRKIYLFFTKETGRISACLCKKTTCFLPRPGRDKKAAFPRRTGGCFGLHPPLQRGIIDSDRRLRIFRAASSAGYLAVSGEKEN